MLTGQLVARMARRAREAWAPIARACWRRKVIGDPEANAAAPESAQDACPPRRRGTRPRVVIQRRPIGGGAKPQPGRVDMPLNEAIPATLHHVAAALGTSSYSLRPLPG